MEEYGTQIYEEVVWCIVPVKTKTRCIYEASEAELVWFHSISIFTMDVVRRFLKEHGMVCQYITHLLKVSGFMI